MKIENLRTEKSDGKVSVAATVTWEDCGRPTREVYFETIESFAEDLFPNPHAFLTGCLLPAMHHGEERIHINAPVCPELTDGLITAASWIRRWFEPERQPVRIEARKWASPKDDARPKRTASFFSGGIDSLAALRYNRLHYPHNHPGSIRECLLIYGQNVESDNRIETFEVALKALSTVTRDAEITLIPIYCNIRQLDDDTQFFKQFHGAVLAASAHAFAGRFGLVRIPSSHSISDLFPWGSHPLVDPNYSSSDLRIHYDNYILSRLEKVRLIADWDAALQNIKVCGPNWPGMNCGICEKCVRTMLEMLAVGVLHKSRSFPEKDLSEELVRAKARVKRDNVSFYEELIDPLSQIGRDDLVSVLKNKIAKCYDKHPNWRQRIKHFDRKYLAGNIAAMKRLIVQH